MNSEKKFADSVWHRVVQILQEAMLTGVDCSDLLRQIRVVQDDADPNVLVLSSAYQAQVKSMHEKLLQNAREMQEAQIGNKFIVSGGDGEHN